MKIRGRVKVAKMKTNLDFLAVYFAASLVVTVVSPFWRKMRRLNG